MNDPREPGGTVVPLPTRARPAPQYSPFPPPAHIGAPDELVGLLDHLAHTIAEEVRARRGREPIARVEMAALKVVAACRAGGDPAPMWHAYRGFARALISVFAQR